MSTHPSYRADIDGLRAIAVGAVILFHTGANYFAGGFVGVDVFFVISGFLITSVIVKSLKDERFSYWRFCEARIRRIVPALLLVSALCIPFAWLWMLPGEAIAFGNSLFAVNTFWSNFLFWQESGYFSSAAELKPLLHTWSLSLEMQFYVVFPILLLAVWKYRKGAFGLGLCIATSSAASFFIADWGSNAVPAANFYLLPSRAWELGAGACVALALTRRPGPPPRSAFAAALGLGLIVFGIFAFDQNTPFPGRWAVFPVLGTVLVITFGKGTFVSRVLETKPLVSIGIVSYSLYLWHQPLFAFARIRMVEVTPVAYAVLIVAAGGLAYLSWRYVEKPFRDRTVVPIGKLFSSTALATALTIATGITFHLASGFPQRNTESAVLEQLLRGNTGLGEPCEVRDDCTTAADPTVIVWGDSYAMHLVDGILAASPDVSLVQATKSVCGPLLEVAPVSAKYNKEWANGCLSFNRSVKEYIENTPSLKQAVVSSPFTQFVGGDYETLYEGVIEARDATFAVTRFKETLAWLESRGIAPIVVSPPPYDVAGERDLGLCVVRQRWFGSSGEPCEIKSSAKGSIYDADVLAFLTEIDRDHEVVWLSDFMCDAEHCDTVQAEAPLYRDSGHLSRWGAKWMGQNTGFGEALKMASPARQAPSTDRQ